MLVTRENKIACACKEIALSEGTSHYVWIMNSSHEICAVDRSISRIIFGDIIHSNNLLKLLNVENSCNLIFDRYHLMELEWKKN